MILLFFSSYVVREGETLPVSVSNEDKNKSFVWIDFSLIIPSRRFLFSRFKKLWFLKCSYSCSFHLFNSSTVCITRFLLCFLFRFLLTSASVSSVSVCFFPVFLEVCFFLLVLLLLLLLLASVLESDVWMDPRSSGSGSW